MYTLFFYGVLITDSCVSADYRKHFLEHQKRLFKTKLFVTNFKISPTFIKDFIC